MKDLNKMMKQYQKVQSEMLEQQARLEGTEFEATSGGGMVKARVTGKMELVGITIKPAAIDPEDPEMLQDLVKAAVNEALRKAKQEMESSMQSVTSGMASGLKLPGF